MPSKQDYSFPKATSTLMSSSSSSSTTTTTTTPALPGSSATITSSARPLANGTTTRIADFYQNNSPHYYSPVINANKDRSSALFAAATSSNPNENQDYCLSSESMIDGVEDASAAAAAAAAAAASATDDLMTMTFAPLHRPNSFDVHKNRKLVQQAIDEPEPGFASRDDEVRAAVAATAARVENTCDLATPMTIDSEEEELAEEDDENENEDVDVDEEVAATGDIDNMDFYVDRLNGNRAGSRTRSRSLKKCRVRQPAVRSSMMLEEEDEDEDETSSESSLTSSLPSPPSPNFLLLGSTTTSTTTTNIPFNKPSRNTQPQLNKNNKMAISSFGAVGGPSSTRYFGTNGDESSAREYRAKRDQRSFKCRMKNEPIGDMVSTAGLEPALPTSLHKAQSGRRSADSDANDETENESFAGSRGMRHAMNGAQQQQQHDRRTPERVSMRPVAPATKASPLKKYAISAGLSGLLNIGNTCFMNSVLQCLSNTDPLLKYILQDEYLKELRTTNSPIGGRLMRTFADIVKSLWSDESREVVDTSTFKSQLQRFSSRFMGYSQQDAQEFLRYLLEGLHEDVKRVKTKPQNVPDIDDSLGDDAKSEACWSRYLKFEDSKIFDLFVGQLKSTLKCTHCGHRSVMFDPFWDLSLPVPYEAVKLRQCFEAFTREETLDGDEKPACSKCKQRQKCTKSFSIQKFPKILVIHLKRFSAHDKYRSKLDNTVDFPIENLDLSTFAALAAVNCTYDLYAVSNHMGTALFGHYTAFCRNPRTRTWHKFDDSSVSSVSNIVSSNAYVLFYELRSQN